jgi:hypothetical protein
MSLRGLLAGKLPDAPTTYDRQQLNQIVRRVEQALRIPVERAKSAEDREALDFFLSK